MLGKSLKPLEKQGFKAVGLPAAFTLYWRSFLEQGPTGQKGFKWMHTF